MVDDLHCTFAAEYLIELVSCPLAQEFCRIAAVLSRNLASPYLINTGLNFVELRHGAAGWKTELLLVYLV